MLHSGALVLLLAVASSQFHLYQSVMVYGTGVVDHSACPVTYFGIQYSVLRLTFENSLCKICAAKENPDCLYLVDPQGTQASVEVLHQKTGPGSVIHKTLPNIRSTSHCILKIELKDATGRTHLTYLLYNFGKQTVLRFIPTSLLTQTELNISVVSNNVPVLSSSYLYSDWKYGVIIDGSGCRFSGEIIPAGQSKEFPKNCLKASCSLTADLKVNRLCGPLEVCYSSIGCVPLPR